MHEYPIVVRKIGGNHRLGVEEADELAANVRDIITEGYDRIDVDERSDGERVGTIIASDDNQTITEVRWKD